MQNEAYTQTRYTFDSKRQIVWRELTAYLKSRFNITGKVLDIGCGYGDFINNIEASERSAIDLNSAMKTYLDKDVEFRSGRTSDLKSHFAANSFDWIFSSNLLEHLSREDISRLFSDSFDLLRNGGRFAILMPNYRLATSEYFDDYTHITPISDRSLVDWLQAHGFEIEFSHPGFMPYSLKNSRVPINSWLVKLWLYSPFKPGGKQMLVIGRKPTSR